jgi:hypothetical protein
VNARSALEADVLRAIAAQLPEYRVEEPGLLTRDAGDGTVRWIGAMTSAITPQRLVVTVNVGAEHTAVERALAAILRPKDAAGDGVHPTVIRNLGEVAGDHSRVQWGFDRGTLDGTAGDIARAVRSHGEPFMREMADLSRLEALMRECGREDARLVRVPIVRALRGDHDGACAGSTTSGSGWSPRQTTAGEPGPARAVSACGSSPRFLGGLTAWLDSAPTQEG